MAQNPLGLCLLKVYNELSFQAMVKNSFGFNFDIFVVLKVGCFAGKLLSSHSRCPSPLRSKNGY